MQGKITFIVKDAKSGIIKYKHTQHNMVTNAVKNVLNACMSRGLKTGVINPVSGSDSWIEQLFGGIMIFDDTLSTSHLTPSVTEAMHMIGCANNNTDPENDGVKGKLKSVSVQADKAIFSWEFGEGACNGDIKAVALTSRVGGELGCKILSRDNTRTADTFNLGQYGLSSLALTSLLYDLLPYGIRNVSGIYLYENNTLVKIDTEPQSGVYKRYTMDLSYDNTKDIRPDYVAYGSYKVPYSESEITYTGGYYTIKSPITNYAYQGYCTASDDDIPLYTLHLRKWTMSGVEEKTVPLNNLVSGIKNRYLAEGLIDSDSPDSKAEILGCLNAALANGICVTWGEKLMWFVGRYGTQTAEGDFLSIYVQDEDGSFTNVDVNSEDSIFYSLIDRNGGQTVELYGLLYNKNLTANNKFNIAVIDGDLYLTANDYYFYMNTDSQSSQPVQIYNRPSIYLQNGVSYVGRLEVDETSASPYYMVYGKNYYDPSDYNSLYVVGCNVLRTNYFATIQNLQIPFPKGASDVMTVNYELSSQSS